MVDRDIHSATGLKYHPKMKLGIAKTRRRATVSLDEGLIISSLRSPERYICLTTLI
tara:strand:+ start:1212 stop:1379 length:168 start_codon:yes stop_codon:yes gene_type:complete